MRCSRSIFASVGARTTSRFACGVFGSTSWPFRSACRRIRITPASWSTSDHRTLTLREDIERLVTLADFITVARSPVERDGYSRDIELVPDAEAPSRFAGMLAALLEGLRLNRAPRRNGVAARRQSCVRLDASTTPATDRAPHRRRDDDHDGGCCVARIADVDGPPNARGSGRSQRREPSHRRPRQAGLLDAERSETA